MREAVWQIGWKSPGLCGNIYRKAKFPSWHLAQGTGKDRGDIVPGHFGVAAQALRENENGTDRLLM